DRHVAVGPPAVLRSAGRQIPRVQDGAGSRVPGVRRGGGHRRSAAGGDGSGVLRYPLGDMRRELGYPPGIEDFVGDVDRYLPHGKEDPRWHYSIWIEEWTEG